MRTAHFAAVLLSVSPLASAGLINWPRWLPQLESLIVLRDTNSTNNSTTSPTVGATAPTAQPTQQTSVKTPNASQVNLNTGGENTTTVTATGTGTHSPTHTEYDPVDPAGGIGMTNPPVTAGLQLYKVGDQVTLGWTYTNLQGTPTAIDVLVSCSSASNTWTLTQNMTFQTDAAITWDTGAYQHTAVASPLRVDEYTLIVYDSESNVTATAEAGYLAPYSGFVFGLYTPRPYTDSADGWQCATCSAAMSDMERRALGAAFGMSIITVLSFTWFVVGFGGF